MSYDRQRVESPALEQMLGAYFFPYFEEKVVDPGQMLDRAILDTRMLERLEQSERELARLLEQSPDEASAMENLMPWLSQTGIPDGRTYRGFLVAVLARVRQAIADPASIPDPGEEGDGLRPMRVSRFVDEATANTVSTLVLRAHEQELRAWSDNPAGWWRQHYYLPDTGRTTGVVMRAGHEGTEEVTGVAVVMKRDPETGKPFIFTAYPDLTLPTAPREELPELRHLMGGYFGQDCFDEGGPAQCQLSFQATTTDAARIHVAEQLDALLERDDTQLRADVEALGSYVLPVQLRSWLMRMRWCMDAYDWSDPDVSG